MATKDGHRRRAPRFRITSFAVARWLLTILVLSFAAIVLAVAVVRTYPQLFFMLAEVLPRTPVVQIPDDASQDETFFKYGSIGNEASQGFPFKIWAVLPKVCSKLIGEGGYASFGFTYEPGRDSPIGMSRVRLGPPEPFGVEQIAINCAVCHVQTFKLEQGGQRRTFVGGAANLLESQRYLRFLNDCAASSYFETDKVLDAMEQRAPLHWLERQVYRHVIIPITRGAILDQIGKRYVWTWSRPAWGPGRVDPFNPVKFDYLRQPIDKTIGNSDVMPAWNADAKQKMRSPAPWHWDGLSEDLKEVIINSALGDGTSRNGYSEATINRLYRYLINLKSPKSPLVADPALWAQGEQLFQANCASCHAPNGDRVLTIIPLAEIGTDRHRLDMWTREASDAYNNYDKNGKDESGRSWGFPWVLDKFKKRDGYLAQPLAGIWLTGPYLHNGSVPTLDDLLKPPAERPATFVRGLELIDLARGGNAAPACKPREHEGPGFCYDTALPGNGNGGHDYGTRFSEAERRALVHYLLTL